MFAVFRRRPLFYAALIFSFGIFVRHFFFAAPPARQVSNIAFLDGVIVSEIEERQTHYGGRNVTFVLKNPALGRVKCYLTGPRGALSYGDEVRLKGELALPKGVRNPGGFDKRAYLDRLGIRTLFYGERGSSPQILSRGHGNFFRRKAVEVKRSLSEMISERFSSRDAAFLKALFLGERTGLEEDFKDLFIKTGTMHILAVSGFNIGFLLVTLLFLLKPFSVPKNIRRLLMIAAVWLYCLLVGWQAPVVRASIMATLFIMGKLLGRKSDVLNTLGLAAVVILLVNPKQLFDVGFQLSFLSVYAIAEFLPLFVSAPELLPNEPLTAKEKVFLYARELFWISFVCLLATLPVTVQNFYIVTPLSLLANMIVVPLSFLIFFCGICFFLTFWVGKFFFVIPFVLKIFMELFTRCLIAVENLPGAYFICGKLDAVLWVLLVAGIFYLFKTKKFENKFIRAVCLVLFAGNVLLGQSTLRHFHREFKMTVLDVGQGDAIYFEFPGGGNLLIDAGKGGDGDRGRWVIKPFLWSKGVNAIDAVVTSHPQEDHIGGMPSVFDEFKIRHVIDAATEYGSKTFKRLQNKIASEKAEHFIVRKGQTIEGFPDIQMLVLNPSPGEMAGKNVNNGSVVLKIVYGGTSFLLTGDIEQKAIAGLIEDKEILHSDVLKVPHHGAKLGASGEAFVKAVAPGISVISVGEKNAYRHPAPETLEILEAIAGNAVFRTDKHSAVEIVSDGHSLSLTSAAN